MGGISEIAADIEELFYVENKTVFEIAEIVKFPVTEIRQYLEQIDDEATTLPDLDDSDFDDLAEFYGHGDTFCEFD